MRYHIELGNITLFISSVCLQKYTLHVLEITCTKQSWNVYRFDFFDYLMFKICWDLHVSKCHVCLHCGTSCLKELLAFCSRSCWIFIPCWRSNHLPYLNPNCSWQMFILHILFFKHAFTLVRGFVGLRLWLVNFCYDSLWLVHLIRFITLYFFLVVHGSGLMSPVSIIFLSFCLIFFILQKNILISYKLLELSYQKLQ